MLLTCPNEQCTQKLVLIQDYGQLSNICPFCKTDLNNAKDTAKSFSEITFDAGDRAFSLDGTEMTYVPSGPFIMGSDLEEIKKAFTSASQKYMDVMWIHFERELPKREVDIPGFWIDVTPVTCDQYMRFCEQTNYKKPEYWKNGQIPDGYNEHPVVDISFEDAVSYCKWSGKRLPYETEWEKAARGTDGRMWPWGNEYMENCGNINQGISSVTTPVGSFPQGASPYGCLDMAGNVFELTRDICVQYPGYTETDELLNIREEMQKKQRSERTMIFKDGVVSKEVRPFQFSGNVARGGSRASCAEYNRTTFRLDLNSDSGIGFRCVLGEDPCDQCKNLGELGNFEQASIVIEQSLDLSPNYPTALFNSGWALQNLNRFKDAAERFESLVSVCPTDHDAWNRLGLCESAMGNINKAVLAFDTAIYTNPFGVDFWYNKAMGLNKLVKTLADPYTTSETESNIFLDLSKLPIDVVQSMAQLHAEAAGCFLREIRLGAKDHDVTKGQKAAKQNSESATNSMRDRMTDSDYLRAIGYVDFCEQFPIVQQIWAVIRKYHADGNFTYEHLRKYGFADTETSTCLTYLKTWGRIETMELATFSVKHAYEISSYDPCYESL